MQVTYPNSSYHVCGVEVYVSALIKARSTRLAHEYVTRLTLKAAIYSHKPKFHTAHGKYQCSSQVTSEKLTAVHFQRM